MAWNIQFFTGNKLPEGRVSGLAGRHIVDAIGQIAPDILVIIEVRTGEGKGVGSLATGNGPGGLEILHNNLGGQGAGWYVVPPQVLNQQPPPPRYIGGVTYFEAIGVFFKGPVPAHNYAGFDFLGPNVWTQHGAVSRGNPALGAQPYDGTQYAKYLPTTPPRMCGYNNLNQNCFAGQAQFNDAGGGLLTFPDRADRMPFFTAFWDAANNRVIKLVSVHLPPTPRRAQLAMQSLATAAANVAQPLVTGPPPSQDVKGVQVIVGDFNINASDPNQSPAYSTIPGYAGQVPVTGMAATMLRGARPRNPPLYQAYRKRASGGGPYLALDNALVSYYGGAQNPHLEICDWVPLTYSGGPYKQAYMWESLQNISSDLEEGQQGFLNPYNYGKIRTASDHMAIVVDV